MPLTTNETYEANKVPRTTLSLMMPDRSRLSSLIACITSAAAGTLFTILSGTSASAQNFVQNGNFTQTTNGNGQLGYNTNVTGWSVANNTYNFVFSPGTIDKTGTTGASGGLYMWGPNSGSNNGLTGIAPTGGNIIAADGAYEVGAISQALTGLTAGKSYVVSFDWGGAQQYNYSGATTEQWQVFFGSQQQNTPVIQNASQGFTGWQHQSFTFAASSASQVLSFLAAGTPNGEPPFSLLSGISVTAAPEPGALGLALTGVATGVMLIRRRKQERKTL